MHSIATINIISDLKGCMEELGIGGVSIYKFSRRVRVGYVPPLALAPRYLGRMLVSVLSAEVLCLAVRDLRSCKTKRSLSPDATEAFHLPPA